MKLLVIDSISSIDICLLRLVVLPEGILTDCVFQELSQFGVLER